MRDPLFVLGPPYSHASIICAAIGEHPECYALPGTNLFIDDTLGEAWDALPGIGRHARDGLLRAVAHLVEGSQTAEDVEDAGRWIERRRNWPVSSVFEYFREAVAPRLLVEGSPAMAARPEYLRRMHASFPTASFLHVARHPRSMERAMLANYTDSAVTGRSGAAPDPDPEIIWQNAHQNILDLASRLPIAQMMYIRAEDFLADARLFLPQIAVWLDVSDKPKSWRAMLHPERWDFARRGPANAPLGVDPDFLASPVLPAKTQADSSDLPVAAGPDWDGEGFSSKTVKFARQFGYG